MKIRILVFFTFVLAFLPKAVQAQIYPPAFVYTYEDQAVLAVYNPPTWLNLPEMGHWTD